MHLELVILLLLVAVAGLAAVAERIRVPYPILLVVGGLALGLLPGANEVVLPPDLVLLIFLPPLLYAAAFFNNPRELARNAGPIGLLAVGLVAATTLSVAVLAHEVLGLSWPVAFVLGAIVSPTDVVAPALIIRRLGVPRRVVTIIEGENLTNDWTALTIYTFAVAAVVEGEFSAAEAFPRFLLTGVGGLAVGLAAGVVIRWVRKRLDDPPTEITISLFSGYAAYLPAEQLGVSGVIAAVAVGLYMGWYTAELTTAETRIQLEALWEVLQFLLNAVLFVLVGLQLVSILGELGDDPTRELILDGVLVSAVVILTRLGWVGAIAWLPRTLSRRLRARDPLPSWRLVLIVAWSSMRGAVALAAALAVPLALETGAPFPARDQIIFLTYCVILATLVLQGLTLGPLIRLLGVEDDGLDLQEEFAARLRTAEAASARLDELAGEDWVLDDTAQRTRGLLEFRRRRFAARLAGGDDGGAEDRSGRYQRLQRELLTAERHALVELRNRGEITDEVMRRVQRDLDLEEARLDRPPEPSGR